VQRAGGLRIGGVEPRQDLLHTSLPFGGVFGFGIALQ